MFRFDFFKDGFQFFHLQNRTFHVWNFTLGIWLPSDGDYKKEPHRSEALRIYLKLI